MKQRKPKTAKPKIDRAAAAENRRRSVQAERDRKKAERAEAKALRDREKADAEAEAEAAAKVNAFPTEAEAINEQYHKWDTIRGKAENLQITAEQEKKLLANIIADAKAKVGRGQFKSWIDTHTDVSFSTAKRILLIADGRGEEVRQQERDRQTRHRADKKAAVTPPPVTAEPEPTSTSTSTAETPPVVVNDADFAPEAEAAPIVETKPEIEPVASKSKPSSPEPEDDGVTYSEFKRVVAAWFGKMTTRDEVAGGKAIVEAAVNQVLTKINRLAPQQRAA